jgi:hypothetical protein
VAERRKDFDDKAHSGFLVGYAQQNTGFLVFVPALEAGPEKNPVFQKTGNYLVVLP